MTDVFISYSRSTEAEAKRIEEALRALGHDVWRDDQLPAHRSYGEVLEERLMAAKAVVVIWSAEAAKSEWVRSEADRARNDRKLVQVKVDATALPMPFDQLQCADLRGWTGDSAATGWRKVVASVTELVGAIHTPALAAASPIAQTAKPSIAVLPFTDMTGVRGEDYFADGMVEEIATALSRFPTLFVNAGGANGAYRQGGRDLGAIASELGVRYLLEGSVRKAGDRVRIAVKLIDAGLGEQLWAERFEGVLEDVFALQDTVANAVASQIEPNIEAAELRRAQDRPTQNLGAYDLWLRALAQYRIFEPEALLEALAMLDQAIARDPDYALALSLAGYCHALRCINAWSEDPAASARIGLELAQRALRVAGDDPRVLSWVGATNANLGGDWATVEALLTRALRLNPGSSQVCMMGGWMHIYAGRYDAGLALFDDALRLDPRSPDTAHMLNGKAWALFGMARYADSVPLHREAADLLAQFEGPRMGMVAAYTHLGRIAEAKSAVQGLHKATVDGLVACFRDHDCAERVRSGIAMAGGFA